MSRTVALCASSIVLALGCTTKQGASSRDESAAQASAAQPVAAQAPAAAAPGVDSAGWRSLSALAAWRGYQSDSVPSGWSVRNGTLVKTGPSKDIITRDQFGDFELTFDWKVEPGGNAGIFYRGTEEYDHIYWSAPEYQLLDDAKHPDGRSRLTSAAAAYAIYPSPAGVVKPGGQWNSTRIIVRGSHVEHWLNGRKVVEYELGSPDWVSKVKASKFNEYPNYGLARRGYIAIQGDHEGKLEIRDIRVRELT